MPPLPVPTSVAFFLEVIVPGLIGTLLAHPLLPEWARLGSGASGLVGLTAVAVIFGLTIHLLRMPLVELAMGRFWPGRIRKWRVSSIQRWADNLRAQPAQAQSSDGLPDVTAFHRLWDLRGLDLLVAGPGGKRIAYCPTMVGNGYFAFTTDLYMAFEVEHRLMGSPVAVWEAQKAATRLWYLMSKDQRDELRELGAANLALHRLTVAAIVVLVAYLVDIAMAPGLLRRDLAMAALCLVVARVTYVAGLSEIQSFIASARALTMALDRDTVQAIRAYLDFAAKQAAQQAQGQRQDVQSAGGDREGKPPLETR